MTLGELLVLLKTKDSESKHWNLAEPHSYYGHPGHIALRSLPGVITASELIQRLERLPGMKIVGQDDKDYEWSLQTPVWVADVGEYGFAVQGWRGGLELVYDEG